MTNVILFLSLLLSLGEGEKNKGRKHTKEEIHL